MTTVFRRLASAFALIAATTCWSSIALAQGTPLFEGTVRNRTTNAPLGGVRIIVGHQSCQFILGCTLVTNAQTTTASDGTYAITQLNSTSPDGRYLVVAGGPTFVTVTFPDRICYSEDCFFQQIPTTVTPPASGIDLRTEAHATVAGRVVRAGTGASVASALMSVSSSNSTSRNAYSAADGTYRFQGLVPGGYRVTARSEDDTLLVQKYPGTDIDVTFNGAGSPDLELSPGQVATADFQLNPAGCFRGTLLSARNGDPVEASILVKREGLPGSLNTYVESPPSATGSYAFRRLLPGTVRVQFRGDIDSTAYFPNFFDNAETEQDSDLVTVTSGVCAEGVDALLVPRHSVAGEVRSGITGAPLAGVLVEGLQLSFIGIPVVRVSDVTDANGRYLLQGFFRTGTNYFRAQPSRGHAGEAFLDRPLDSQPSSWTRLDIVDGEHRMGVDFTVGPVPFISGRVHNLPPGAGYNVQVLFASGGNVADYTNATSDNYYSNGLAPGSYRIAFAAGGRLWVHPGILCTTFACDEPGATVVSVGAPQEYPGYDFDFDAFDSIFADTFE